MASRSGKPKTGSYEAIDKVASSTLKRHPKMELSKNDLLRLLSYLEGELQARDISIAVLKTEKAKQMLYQAKYGRFGLGDPFLALQRGVDGQKDNGFDEAAIKTMYDNQLTQLENLIATQKKAQHRMREQLCAVEKRYHKVCAELEEEKRKHAQDTAQGDDVTYMLEKERERLKQEIDFEKGQNKKLEKELKKATTALEEEQANSNKHKQVAIMLIKERKKLVEKLIQSEQLQTIIEHSLMEEKNKMKNMAEGLVQESQKSLHMEAALEKQLLEFDVEREQLKKRLSREESRNADLDNWNKELSSQVEILQQQVESLQWQMGTDRRDGPKSIEIRSSVNKAPTNKEQAKEVIMNSISGMQNPPAPRPSQTKVFKNTPPNTPPEVRKFGLFRESPEREGSPVPYIQQRSSPSVSPDRTVISDVSVVPASGVQEMLTQRYNINATGPPGTHVFTTPSGSKISVHVGTPASQSRKPVPIGRGQPPPIPPNKPLYVPQNNPGKPVTVSGARSPSAALRTEVMSPVLGEPARRPPPPNKLANTVAMEKSPVLALSPNDNVKQLLSSSGASSPRQIQIPVAHHTSSAPTGAPGGNDGMRKASQSSLPQHNSQSTDVTEASSTLDYLGSEMTDLQQLLVSMVTGESGASSVDSVTPSTPDIHNSPLHTHATCGQLSELQSLIDEDQIDVNSTMKDGTTALLCAAETGQEVCLQLLLDRGADVTLSRYDGYAPIHAAAAQGNHGCLKLLLAHCQDVNVADQSGLTPLYWAAAGGHANCCQVLLSHKANPLAMTSKNWTPLHATIQEGHPACLKLLLMHCYSADNTELTVDDVISMADKDGRTMAHLAAARETKDCLEILCSSFDLDLEKEDKWGRSVRSVATAACTEFLSSLDSRNHRTCSVAIQISPQQIDSTNSKLPLPDSYIIGSVVVTTETAWSVLEEDLHNLLSNYFKMLSAGIRSKKINKLDPESPDSPPYALGLSLNSVKFYCIGLYNWSPGTPSEKSPFHILSNNECKTITVKLFGWDDDCIDGLSYETLISVSCLQNYLRLIEQYKKVIFYGPSGCGKSYLSCRLAQCLLEKEKRYGKQIDMHFETLNEDYKKEDLYHVLIHSGCLLPYDVLSSKTVILILDGLGQGSTVGLGELLSTAEDCHKENTPVKVYTDGHGEKNYCFARNCYIIGTLDRSRSTGLELSIQQHFRWVHLRNDIEPMKTLLARHFCRRLVDLYRGSLPGPDDHVFRAVEWVICVWQRLTEGLNKLGLVDIVFGAANFLSCPLDINKPKAILRWLSLLWNHVISPAVSRAVIRGSGAEDLTPTGGQQKVAKTALYVLMQRAIVPGCPLSGQEKERYLSSFQGSNELDIKMRVEKKDGRNVPSTLPLTKEYNPDDPRAPPLKNISEDVAKRVADIMNCAKESSSPESQFLTEEAPLSPVKDMVYKFEQVTSMQKDSHLPDNTCCVNQSEGHERHLHSVDVASQPFDTVTSDIVENQADSDQTGIESGSNQSAVHTQETQQCHLSDHISSENQQQNSNPDVVASSSKNVIQSQSNPQNLPEKLGENFQQGDHVLPVHHQVEKMSSPAFSSNSSSPPVQIQDQEIADNLPRSQHVQTLSAGQTVENHSASFHNSPTPDEISPCNNQFNDPLDGTLVNTSAQKESAKNTVTDCSLPPSVSDTSSSINVSGPAESTTVRESPDRIVKYLSLAMEGNNPSIDIQQMLFSEDTKDKQSKMHSGVNSSGKVEVNQHHSKKRKNKDKDNSVKRNEKLEMCREGGHPVTSSNVKKKSVYPAEKSRSQDTDAGAECTNQQRPQSPANTSATSRRLRDTKLPILTQRLRKSSPVD